MPEQNPFSGNISGLQRQVDESIAELRDQKYEYQMKERRERTVIQLKEGDTVSVGNLLGMDPLINRVFIDIFSKVEGFNPYDSDQVEALFAAVYRYNVLERAINTGFKGSIREEIELEFYDMLVDWGKLFGAIVTFVNSKELLDALGASGSEPLFFDQKGEHWISSTEVFEKLLCTHVVDGVVFLQNTSHQVVLRIRQMTTRGPSLEYPYNEDCVGCASSENGRTCSVITADGVGRGTRSDIASLGVTIKILSILEGENQQVPLQPGKVEMVISEAREFLRDGMNYMGDSGTSIECVQLVLMKDSQEIEMRGFHKADSRTYIEQEVWMQLTRDQTHFQDMLEQGHDLTEADRFTSQSAQLVTGSIAATDFYTGIPSQFLGPVKLQVGHQVLQCSDGIWGLVKDINGNEISTLAMMDTVDIAKQALLHASDNASMTHISVIEIT